ncbi:zinc-dependent alcohol dehydrogenase [Bacillus solitudinis]|uniref:zinc-dependent alcohol dehydrogenase n=1 Tax=Bacillus solitudinis TaxID=2014074 RepID=UPI000C23B578|nr:alcohol dehydrogenase catalytic domain-containing protein [Bacillus solitudinis]
MNALQFKFDISKYTASKILGRWFPSLHWHPTLSCLSMSQIKEPPLPNEDWVKIKVRFGGICGSDMNLLFLHDSPATSPFASFPFTIGHEAVGQIAELGNNVEGFSKGQRVVVNPLLSCESRGLEYCPACQRGDESLCHYKTKGDIGPGLLIGACKKTGGSWSPYLVAHKSQILALPEEVNDSNGVLIEPFSCALHAVLRNPPKQGGHALVIGAGMIGLSIIAALKALDYCCIITVLVKHTFQGEMAKKLGADYVVYLNDSYIKQVAEIFKAERLRPIFGQEVIQGGADTVYECVGNSKSVNDALRLTQSGGSIVLLGLASMMKIDWTTVWLNELSIKGCFAYSSNEFEGSRRSTLDIAIELMKRGKVDLSSMITHRYPLHEYKTAFSTITNKSSKRVIKVVFEHDIRV